MIPMTNLGNYSALSFVNVRARKNLKNDSALSFSMGTIKILESMITKINDNDKR